MALIARRHKVSAENIAQWNKVAASASFKAGETVVLYLPAGSGAARSAGPKAGRKAQVATKAQATGKAAATPKRKSEQAARKAEPKR